MYNDSNTRLSNVGIIPDGNRRWARQNQQNFDIAYWLAMQKLTLVIDILFELGVSSISTYLLSKDNLTRKRDDLESVLMAEQKFLTELLPALKAKYNLKIFHAGDRHLLPEKYVQALDQSCEPDSCPRTTLPSLFLCAGYDPIDEISQNISRMTESADILDNLWVPHLIDLVIRTGDDRRISGFLPLQCRYAEFFFEPYFFPEINRERLEAIVREFCTRERRFGK